MLVSLAFFEGCQPVFLGSAAQPRSSILNEIDEIESLLKEGRPRSVSFSCVEVKLLANGEIDMRFLDDDGKLTESYQLKDHELRALLGWLKTLLDSKK